MDALFGQVRLGLSSFIVALAGVGLAYLWKQTSVLLVLGIAIALVGIGVGAYFLGKRCLVRDKPKAQAARRLFEWTLAAPIALAALAAAVIIILAIDFAAEKSWSEERKQLTAAAVAAITTFLTTAFVKGTGDADAGLVGSLVKRRFETDLMGRFPKQAKARDAAFDTTRGWDRDTRKERATEIDSYIKEGGTTTPRPS
jgi:hypothetical protein